MSEITWVERFAPIDKMVASMPPVDRACSTCTFADIPPLPADPKDGWIAHCRVPMPVNTLLDVTEVKMSFAAADAERWESKRQKPCPAWRSE